MEESLTRRLTRYGIVAAIVIVLGALYVQREILTDDEVMVPAVVTTATETAADSSDDSATEDSATDEDGSTEDGSTEDSTGGSTMVSVGLVDDRSLEVDELAPDFRLTDLDGRVVMLSDFRGKTVVLNFWASWCPPCREEMPEFQALWDERGAEGSDDLVVLAVNFLRDDTVGAATNFIRGQRLHVPRHLRHDTRRGRPALRRARTPRDVLHRPQRHRAHHGPRPRVRQPARDGHRGRRHRGRHGPVIGRTARRLGAFAALLALGALLAVACGDSASDGQLAERAGSTSGFPTGPAVMVPEGFEGPSEGVGSTGAWLPDNGQPTLVFVDAIW